MGHALVPSIGVALAATAAAIIGTLGPREIGESRASPPLKHVEIEPLVGEVRVLPAPRLRGRRQHRMAIPYRMPVETTVDCPHGLGEVVHRDEVERREKAAGAVRNYVERGQSYEGKENFDAAVQAYQKALAILSWYTDQRDFSITADRARDMIEYATRKAEIHERLTRQKQIRTAQMEREQELSGERERRLNKIRAYFDEANLAFRRDEYVLAREHARQILLLDPQNVDAEKLIRICDDARRSGDDAESRRLFNERWRAVFVAYDRGVEIVTINVPDDWSEGDASSTAILTTLETKRVKDLTWDHANLDQVVGYLRTITGLKFFITAKVRAEVYDEVEVTLDLDDVTVKTVLDLATEPFELRWTPENGVVTITAMDEAVGGLFIRYFDVTCLLDPQDVNSFTDSHGAPHEPTQPPVIDSEQVLLDLVRETVGDDRAWERPAVLEIRNRCVVARNEPRTLDRVAAFIEALIAEAEATGDLRSYLTTRRWSTVTGAPPRTVQR